MGYWGDMPCSAGDLHEVGVEYGEEEQAVDAEDDSHACMKVSRLSRADHMITGVNVDI